MAGEQCKGDRWISQTPRDPDRQADFDALNNILRFFGEFAHREEPFSASSATCSQEAQISSPPSSGSGRLQLDLIHETWKKGDGPFSQQEMQLFCKFSDSSVSYSHWRGSADKAFLAHRARLSLGMENREDDAQSESVRLLAHLFYKFSDSSVSYSHRRV